MTTKKLTKKERELLWGEAERNARHALILSILGIIILGVVLEPFALYYSIKARKTLENIDSKDSTAWAIATTALVFSATGVAIIGLGVFAGIMAGVSGY